MERFLEYKKEIFLILIILISILFLIFGNLDSFTGNITQGSTLSNVSVSKYLAISFSSNLENGIQFGNVSFLPATDINATHNYDGTNSSTTFYINVSTDSNSGVDFCIKANAKLTNDANDTIGLGNETYSNSTLTNLTEPPLNNQTPLTTSYSKSGVNIPIGGTNYWRFWLDIPSSQPSGSYNNTISFKGVSSGVAC